MKSKMLLMVLCVCVLLSGCSSINPWSEDDPDNRMRKSPCASLSILNAG